jgi:hypothetical protein
MVCVKALGIAHDLMWSTIMGTTDVTRPSGPDFFCNPIFLRTLTATSTDFRGFNAAWAMRATPADFSRLQRSLGLAGETFWPDSSQAAEVGLRNSSPVTISWAI